jgi:hypothetical protein
MEAVVLEKSLDHGVAEAFDESHVVVLLAPAVGSTNLNPL